MQRLQKRCGFGSEVFTENQEDKLWDMGLLGDKTPHGQI